MYICVYSPKRIKRSNQCIHGIAGRKVSFEKERKVDFSARVARKKNERAADRSCRKRSPSSLAKLAQCQGAWRVHLRALGRGASSTSAGGGGGGRGARSLVTLPPSSFHHQPASRSETVRFARLLAVDFHRGFLLSRPTCERPLFSRKQARGGIPAIAADPRPG